MSEEGLNRSPISFSHLKTPGWTCEVRHEGDSKTLSNAADGGPAAGHAEFGASAQYVGRGDPGPGAGFPEAGGEPLIAG